MIKKTWTTFVFLVLTNSNAFAQNNFKQEFTRYNSLAVIRARLVHNGAITSLWANNDLKGMFA